MLIRVLPGRRFPMPAAPPELSPAPDRADSAAHRATPSTRPPDPTANERGIVTRALRKVYPLPRGAQASPAAAKPAAGSGAPPSPAPPPGIVALDGLDLEIRP